MPGVVAGVTPLPAVASCVLTQPEAGKAVVAECRGERPRWPLAGVALGCWRVQQLTANSALVPDGASHAADSSVRVPSSGCNAYLYIDAGWSLWALGRPWLVLGTESGTLAGGLLGGAG